MRVRRNTTRSVAITAAIGLGAAGLAAAAPAAAETTDPIAHYLFDAADGVEIANEAGSAFGPAVVERGTESDWTGTSLGLRGGPKGGTGNYVRLPDDMLADQRSATVSIEVKPSAASLGGYHFLWNFGGESDTENYFFSSLNQDGRTPLVGISNGGSETLLQSDALIDADEWVNITSVIDGDAGTASFYIDGELVRTGSMPHTPADIDDQSFNSIGYAPWPDPLFQGEVASFRVYDSALDEAAVSQISAEDAAIHGDEFQARAQEIIDGLAIEPEITTTTHLDLPSAGGQVTWTTSDESVVAADGTVVEIVEGEPQTATLTASASVRGFTATRDVHVTVEADDETPEERIERLAGGFVLPHILASTTALPAAPAGTEIVDVRSDEATYADGVLSGSGAATVQVDLVDVVTERETTRDFRVEFLDDARDLLAYDRTPSSSGEANNADIAMSMHLALDGEPLFHGYGIFFAHIAQTPGPWGTSSNDLRSLVDPHLAYLDDGGFGIVSTRTARGGGDDGTQASSVLLTQSPDLLDYDELGLLDLGVTSGVNQPAFAYDQAAGHYVIAWTNDAGASYWATFDEFSADAEVSAPVRGAIDLIGDDAEGDIEHFRSGSSLPVSQEVARELEIRFNPIRNVDAEWNADIAIAEGEEFDAGSLSDRIELMYDDGSTNDLVIEWDADAIAAIDTSAPGTYEIPGTVKQPVYPAPLADERADPMILPFDFNGEQKFLMIATKDLHLDPVNNGGQPTGMPLRVADSIEELADENGGADLEVDLLKAGDLGPTGEPMTGCFWAPEMHMIDGVLSILFMPCYNPSGSNRPDAFTGRASIIQLKQDESGAHLDPSVPENWTDIEYVLREDGSPLNDLQGISLDMSFFEDGDQAYYTWQMLGSVFIATMDTSDPTRLTSEPVRIIAPEYAWDNTIAEGQNVFIRDGKIFMPYAGSLVGDTYATGLAWAETGVDLTDPDVWERNVYPLHKSEPYEGEWLLGPGHGAWSEDEDGNQLWVFHVRTHNNGLSGRDAFVHRVHWTSQGLPRFNTERDHELAPEFREITTTVRVGDGDQAIDPQDPFGYLMVHFVEDAEGYAEKIHLSVSQGDDPEKWDRLNGGDPVLASAESTTGVRDPYITYSPADEKYFIIGTDLRVFGGDDAGWGGWTDDYSTRVNVWESEDLITWSEQRQFDVALDADGEPAADAPHMDMMWAPEATWVPDYYGEGDGAFVMYWSSNGDNGYHRVMWGATRDFSQESWEFGGVFIDEGDFTIDTTMTQHDGKTYRVTKHNPGDRALPVDQHRGLYMEVTDAERWWEPETEWETTQTQLGAEYSNGNPGGVEGPAIFRAHGEDRWYLYVDVIPQIGYQPLVSTDLDADEPWQLLESDGFELAPSTKHGGVIGLTKGQYDAIRQADASDDPEPVTVEVPAGAEADEILAALPAEVTAPLHDGGAADFPVAWDVPGAESAVVAAAMAADAGEVLTVSGDVLGTIGANLNDWVGEDGSTAWDAPGKTPFSSTALTATAHVTFVEPGEETPGPGEETPGPGEETPGGPGGEDPAPGDDGAAADDDPASSGGPSADAGDDGLAVTGGTVAFGALVLGLLLAAAGAMLVTRRRRAMS